MVAISSRCSDRRGSVMVSRLQFTRVFTARQELRRRIQKQVIDPIALERNQFILSACQNHKQATRGPEPETLHVGLLCRRHAGCCCSKNWDGEIF